MVVVVVALELQPTWKTISAKNPLSSKPSTARRVRGTFPTPIPSTAKPNTGSPMAYKSRSRGASCVVVVTRATVLMMRSVLTGPFRFWKLGVVSVHVAAVGRPELQATATVLGKIPVGARVAVYWAGTPAATVAVDGAILRLKSFTVT